MTIMSDNWIKKKALEEGKIAFAVSDVGELERRGPCSCLCGQHSGHAILHT